MTKSIRKIIKIDESLCTGCGNCIPECQEQALILVDTPNGKKARLVKEIYCDGLGACLGACPTGALTIEEREAEPFDHEATQKFMTESTKPSPEPSSIELKFTGCPGSQTIQWDSLPSTPQMDSRIPSCLQQWPVQLHLVSPSAPYFKNAELVFIADCVPFAYPNLHQDFLKGKAIAVCCPKLDDIRTYSTKIANIIKIAHPKSIQVVHMTVPCCFGLIAIVEDAIKQAGSDLPIKEVIINLKGEKQTRS
ncbi:MAG: ATP-binding protein [Candidatus Helarchaeota archaeon]